ncbi:prolyl 3-hydroxylase OGFOD1 isoform X1 [Patella vulgata]|uniref:prolyl 3-hydroxylase OGFOD1 isoform X1 n=1 Tax=Patella vulgata TaxID=6465 RepID=UPI0024A84592|nr:prolyl 3-hydroxylase OGFOD1 isoform X1 [Patella vulgata]
MSDEPVIKKKKGGIKLKIQKTYSDQSFVVAAQKCYASKIQAECEQYKELHVDPFFHAILPNFITDEDFVESLEKELSQLKFREKNNDLYKFHQSKDLKHVKSQCITEFCEFLQNDVKEWLSNISGISLTDVVDSFCSKYEYTDILLCHDDELEKRRIAYIYYLVPPSWNEEDGGTLDLFTSDDHIQPKDIVKSVVPKRNNFLFFEVTERSFHQVAEVLSKESIRLAVSGWFHGPSLPRQKPNEEPSPLLTPYITVGEDNFYNWINPIYLHPETQGDISEKFESESEIQLSDFIQKEKFNLLLSALQESNIPWSPVGPANKRKYYLCNKENQPKIVEECVHFLQSEAMFLVLSNMTGLKLHELAPESDSEDSEEEKNVAQSSQQQNGSQENNESTNHSARSKETAGVSSCCSSEVRKWQHGCYTLAHDTSHESNAEFALDAVLYIGCSDWKTEYGGFTSYIAKDEDDELLSVSPENNCLALVYRDKNTLRFVKHINHQSTQHSQPYFYDISTVYYE